MRRRIPYAFWKTSGGAATWPFGASGDLTVLNGQTVDINLDQIYDYNNVTVDAGGLLRVVYNGSYNPCILGVAGNLVVNGQISYSVGNTTAGGTYSKTDPLGNTFSYTISQRNGGAGGRGGSQNTGTQASGGSQSQGRGGGGGGGGGNQTAFGSAGNGGNGGSNGANQGTGQYLGGLGGGTGNGSSGRQANSSAPGETVDPAGTRTGGNGSGGGGAGSYFVSKAITQGAGGGGGGYRGVHGYGLAIVTHGSVSGTGSIFLSGLSGYNGGSGGRGWIRSTYPPNGQAHGAAGGGGGGAGGSGGALWVYHRTGFSLSASVSGGSGGSGGSVSFSNSVGSTIPLSGGSGQSGNAGSITTSTTW